MVSHPIQYQVPLLRLIAVDPDFDLFVIFESKKSGDQNYDVGFGRQVKWDIPLTDGLYYCEAIDNATVQYQLSNCDVLWVHGWDSKFKRGLLKVAQDRDIPVLIRGENTQESMPDGRGIKGILKRLIFDFGSKNLHSRNS